jgi:hypothetical protein
MQNNFDEILTNLENRLQKLFSKFLSPHLQEKVTVGRGLQIENPIEYILVTQDGSLYQIDIEAYMVLSHAAFEDFFEKMALETVKQSVEMWHTHNQINNTLLLVVSYMLSSGGEINEEESETNKQKSSNRLDLRTDHKTLRNKNLSLDDITQSTTHIDKLIGESQLYFHNKLNTNHGIEIKFLIKVLIPVALDVSIDGRESINFLANKRGEAAHKTQISRIPTPLDVIQNEKHILKFCEELCQQAKAKF